MRVRVEASPHSAGSGLRRGQGQGAAEALAKPRGGGARESDVEKGREVTEVEGA